MRWSGGGESIHTDLLAAVRLGSDCTTTRKTNKPGWTGHPGMTNAANKIQVRQVGKFLPVCVLNVTEVFKSRAQGGRRLSSLSEMKAGKSRLSAHLQQSFRPPDLVGRGVCVHGRLMRDVSLQETGVVEAIGSERHGWCPEGDTDTGLRQGLPLA